MERASAAAAPTGPAAAVPAANEEAAKEPPSHEPCVRYADGVQGLLVWHAAKQIQSLVYEITNEMDPLRRPSFEVRRQANRARDILRWAQAMVNYCEAAHIEITTIMDDAGKK